MNELKKPAFEFDWTLCFLWNIRGQKIEAFIRLNKANTYMWRWKGFFSILELKTFEEKKFTWIEALDLSDTESFTDCQEISMWPNAAKS